MCELQPLMFAVGGSKHRLLWPIIPQIRPPCQSQAGRVFLCLETPKTGFLCSRHSLRARAREGEPRLCRGWGSVFPLPPNPMPPVSLERSFAACGLRPADRRWTTASAARLTAIPSPGGRSRNHRGDCSSAARGYSVSRQQGASGCICRRAGKSPPASMPPCFWLRSLIGCGRGISLHNCSKRA